MPFLHDNARAHCSASHGREIDDFKVLNCSTVLFTKERDLIQLWKQMPILGNWTDPIFRKESTNFRSRGQSL